MSSHRSWFRTAEGLGLKDMCGYAAILCVVDRDANQGMGGTKTMERIMWG